jgi:hypothetical protein
VFGFLAFYKTVKRPPPQIENRIAVLADSLDWADLENTLQQTYERIVRTPQPEKIYTLQHISYEEMALLESYRYIITTASLESVGKVGTWLFNEILSDTIVRKQISSMTEYLFIRNALWNKDQIIVILAGKDRSSLKQQILSDNDRLFAIFEDDSKRCWSNALYSGRNEQKVARRLSESYGWSIEKQASLQIENESPENGFVSFSTLTPNRWLFVRWIEKGNPDLLNPEWVIQERNLLGWNYFEGMQTDPKYLESSRSLFLGHRALITTGLWTDDDPYIGGPFKNYTFYDSATRRIYMIDFAAYDPGKMKIHHMREMDAVAHTFSTKIPDENIQK